MLVTHVEHTISVVSPDPLGQLAANRAPPSTPWIGQRIIVNIDELLRLFVEVEWSPFGRYRRAQFGNIAVISQLVLLLDSLRAFLCGCNTVSMRVCHSSGRNLSDNKKMLAQLAVEFVSADSGM